jgi:hypothetical protein
VLWTFSIVAEEDERVLVDVTDFLIRDAQDLIGILRSSGEGDFRLVRERSFLVPERSGAFEDNTGFEVRLTFVTDWMDGELYRLSPDNRSVTLGQRHSFVRLPSTDLPPRPLDWRIGLSARATWDFDRPPESGNRVSELARWRLEKREPGEAVSEPVEPLVFFLEEGIPQAYRQAIEEGILYWNRPLEAAGFRNAIRVRNLPPGASPLDFQYPIVVAWSPMDFASTSVGAGHPGTGEALKAVVSLASTKPLSAYREYTVARAALGAEAPPFEEFLLQTMRWLAAHEVGHVLGLRHNQASPTVVSPAPPWLRISEEGDLVAEPERIFPIEPYPYDRWAMQYQFTTFSPEKEEAGLEAIVQDGLAKGLQYVNANASRFSPLAAQGLHGRDPGSVLEQELAVRELLLASFGEAVLDPGDPPEILFERLVPAYFHHRYGLGAATNAICGVEFSHARQGDGQAPPQPVASGVQRRALDAIISAVRPEQLAVPKAARDLIPPRHSAFRPFELEVYPNRPGFRPVPAFVEINNSPDGTFDPSAWAEALARLVIDPVLTPERLTRCVSQHAEDSELLSASDLIDRALEETWGQLGSQDPSDSAVGWIARRVVLERVLELAEAENLNQHLQVAALAALQRLDQTLRTVPAMSDREDRHQLRLALEEIARVLGESNP